MQDLMPPIKFEDGHELKFKVHGSGRQPYSQDLITPLCRSLKPSIFGVLQDTFMMMEQPPNWFLNQDFSPAKSCFYFPSDGGACMPQRPGINCANVLKKVDVPISMSKFAQKQVWDLYKIKTEYIPHAIDTNVYKPLSPEERAKLKAKWGFDERMVYNGKPNFVVGSVFRNQGRKMPDRMYKSFSLFAKDVPEARLFLHTDPQDMAQSFDTIQMLRDLNILHKTVFTGMKYWKGFNYSEMNDIYNTMDIFFLSTSGEGWGIPITEAMSAGIPTVITDYTTTREQIIDNGQCGEAVDLAGVKKENNPWVHEKEILDGTLTGSWQVERGIMSVHDGAEKLHKLYDNASLRSRYADVARKKALKYYDWDVVINDWERVFNRMIE